MSPNTGAGTLVSAAVAAGIQVCFTNPGTTELPIVAAIEASGQLRPILVLFEGVAAGAADGYGRMTGSTAMTLLHLGGGLGNAIANLHNAKRARTPILNVVGDQATWHSPFESPLASDVAALARPVSRWVHRVGAAQDIADDVFDGVRAALGLPGGVSTLIVPHNCQWEPATPQDAPKPPQPLVSSPEEAQVDAAAAALRGCPAGVLYLGGRALSTRGLRAARRVELASGCRVFIETFPARLERGKGIPAFPALPYFPEAAVAALADANVCVTAGTNAPITIFATPDTPQPEVIGPGTHHLSLSTPEEDAESALESLAEQLAAPKPKLERRPTVELPDNQKLTPKVTADVLSVLLPEGAVIVDEASTSGYAFNLRLPSASPHTTLSLTGGAIGMGLPVAVGAAVGAPESRVVALQADGSGMYTPQALWTMAREQLDVTVLVFANRRYNILQIEFKRAGITPLGHQARRLTSLEDPVLDWVSLARGLGVPATRITDVSGLILALRGALATPGPHLIEALT